MRFRPLLFVPLTMFALLTVAADSHAQGAQCNQQCGLHACCSQECWIPGGQPSTCGDYGGPCDCVIIAFPPSPSGSMHLGPGRRDLDLEALG